MQNLTFKIQNLGIIIILLGMGILGVGYFMSGCGSSTSTAASSGVTDPSHIPSNNDLSASSFVGSLTCKGCHGGDNADGMYMKWKNSAHGSSESISHGASINCALCHATGYKQSGGYTSGSTEAQMFGVQCEECHGAGSQHVATAQKNIADKENIKKLINKTPNAETTCGKCHRGRVFVIKDGSKYDTPVNLDNKTLVNATIEANLPTSGTASRHPIHYRPNLPVFKGTGGYEYTGSTYLNSYHTAGVSNSCVTCHFQFSSDHNPEPDLAACQACHTGTTTFDIGGRVTEIRDIIGTLGQELASYEARVTKSARTAEAYTRAFWNFTLISKEAEDGKACAGVHNYKYAKQLLQDSIDNFDPSN